VAVSTKIEDAPLPNGKFFRVLKSGLDIGKRKQAVLKRLKGPCLGPKHGLRPERGQHLETREKRGRILSEKGRFRRPLGGVEWKTAAREQHKPVELWKEVKANWGGPERSSSPGKSRRSQRMVKLQGKVLANLKRKKRQQVRPERRVGRVASQAWGRGQGGTEGSRGMHGKGGCKGCTKRKRGMFCVRGREGRRRNKTTPRQKTTWVIGKGGG